MIKRNYKNRTEAAIGAEKAKHYLKFNDYPSQRPLKSDWLDDLAQKADNGLLGTAHLCFAVGLEKTYLMDGQHILTTIVNKDIKLRGEIEEAHVDNENDLTVLFRQFENKRRSQYDMVKAKHTGLKFVYPLWISNMTVSALFMASQWGEGWNSLRLQSTSLSTGIERDTGKRLSMDDKVDLLEKHPDKARFLYNLFSSDNGEINKLRILHVTRSIVIFLIFKTLEINKGDCGIFCKRVTFGENLTVNKPEYKLREFLTSSAIKTRKTSYLPKVTNHEIAYKIALAWNAFRKNSTTTLAYRINKTIPTLI